jgi:hypothetical protein
MYDLDDAWCDIFEKKLFVHVGDGPERCSECSGKKQDDWYKDFKPWREAIRVQDDDYKKQGREPYKYLKPEYRARIKVVES